MKKMKLNGQSPSKKTAITKQTTKPGKKIVTMVSPATPSGLTDKVLPSREFLDGLTSKSRLCKTVEEKKICDDLSLSDSPLTGVRIEDDFVLISLIDEKNLYGKVYEALLAEETELAAKARVDLNTSKKLKTNAGLRFFPLFALKHPGFKVSQFESFTDKTLVFYISNYLYMRKPGLVGIFAFRPDRLKMFLEMLDEAYAESMYYLSSMSPKHPGNFMHAYR